MSMFESRGNLSLAAEAEVSSEWQHEERQRAAIERIRKLGNFIKTLIDPSHKMPQAVMMQEAREMGVNVPDDGVDYEGISRAIADNRLRAGLDDILIANYVKSKGKFSLVIDFGHRPDLWASEDEIEIAENFAQKAEDLLNIVADEKNINPEILTGKL